jgi:hypothetical protein
MMSDGNADPTVPGEFECPDCGFILTKTVINPRTGGFARDSTDRLEPCPNDGSIMRPVKYSKALDEARQMACRHMAKARKGEQMEVFINNLLVRGRLYGHEKKAAEDLLKDWKQLPL